MDIEIRHRPSYALADVLLLEGETLVTESGVMVSMDPHLQVETSGTGGGVVSGLIQGFRRMAAGESVFVNRYTAPRVGRITVAPTLPGDMTLVDLAGGSLILAAGAFLACAASVTVDASWGGGRSLLGGEGLVLLRASGTGPLLFTAFGGIREIEVEDAFVVDTGHVVAFDEGLTFSVGRFGSSWRSFLLGGEGLVCTFRGRGRLWIQGRNPAAFGGLIGAMLPPKG